MAGKSMMECCRHGIHKHDLRFFTWSHNCAHVCACSYFFAHFCAHWVKSVSNGHQILWWNVVDTESTCMTCAFALVIALAPSCAWEAQLYNPLRGQFILLLLLESQRPPEVCQQIIRESPKLSELSSRRRLQDSQRLSIVTIFLYLPAVYKLILLYQSIYITIDEFPYVCSSFRKLLLKFWRY